MMNKMRIILGFICLLGIFWNGTWINDLGEQQDRIKGLTFVAPPKAFPNDPMLAVQAVNAEWIAVIPYAYSYGDLRQVRFDSKRQWWGERTEGVKETLILAKEAGLKVMLKPQLYIPGSWTGDLSFEKEADWQTWEETYQAYLFHFLELAKEYEVELFCVGTEFKKMENEREAYWRSLIAKCRTQFDGKLVYSANWDCYAQVPFWDVLDYVGISAYFPLVEEKTPQLADLLEEWKPIVKDLKHFSQSLDKPILFTEYGYLSVDHCAHKTWELEAKINQLSVNEQAQCNALTALYESFWEENFWAGGFLWKWFPNMQGHEGYPEKDYTPQSKMGEDIVEKWYCF